MKNFGYTMVMLLAACSIVGLVACTHSVNTSVPNTDGSVTVTTTVVQGIDPVVKLASIDALSVATELGADNGFKFWYKSNPDASIAAAQGISVNIKTQILPWLQGGQLKVGPDIIQLLNSKLFANLNPEIVGFVGLVTIPIDLAISGPNASNLLDQDKIDYIIGAMQGIEKGCDEFVAAPKSALKTKATIKSLRNK